MAAVLAVSVCRYVPRGVVEPWSRGGRDFGVDYCAAGVLLAGGDIYDVAGLRSFAAQAGAQMDRGGYIKPPLFAVALTPLAALRFDTARRVWCVLNHAFLIASVLMLAAALFPRGKERRALAAALILLALNAEPVRAHMATGQTNLLVLTLVCAALWAHERGRDSVAGAALGVAVAIKLYPATLVAYFLWKRRWRVALSACAAAAVCAAATVVVLGIDLHVDYALRVLPTLLHHRPDVAHYSNQSIYACFYRLFVDNLYTDAVINSPVRGRVVSAICCGVLVCITALRCRPRSSQVVEEAGLVVMATTVIVTQAWDMNFVLMLLPAGVMLRHLAGVDRPGLWPGAMTWAAALALVFARFEPWQSAAGGVGTLMLLCPRLIGTLALFALLAGRVTSGAAGRDLAGRSRRD